MHISLAMMGACPNLTPHLILHSYNNPLPLPQSIHIYLGCSKEQALPISGQQSQAEVLEYSLEELSLPVRGRDRSHDTPRVQGPTW